MYNSVHKTPRTIEATEKSSIDRMVEAPVYKQRTASSYIKVRHKRTTAVIKDFRHTS